VIECDEAVFPVFQKEAEEFIRQYPDAKISVRSVGAREATADFVNDSVRVIVVARELNAEEKAALAAGKARYEEFKVALSSVAVIAHPALGVERLRVSQMDSIFSGTSTRWPGKGVLDLSVGGRNSSTNEVFREQVLGGKPLALAATPIESSGALVEHVRTTPFAMGIVAMCWLKGMEEAVTVPAVGGPGWRPDSTRAPGQYYTPAQAYVFLGHYPVTTPVMIYSRELDRNVSLGFISYVSSPPGQQVIQNGGLVPATQPVRLVQLTSDQVK
jgi:phosphate transport system substrate-binding protein